MDKKWRAYLLLVSLGLVIFFCYWQYFENKKYHFSVVFFDVGQGDSALINFSNGKKMLVDCGINGNILSKLGSRLPFYDRTIDYLVVTHPDLDHYGGCIDVLKRYQVKNIIENGIQKPSDNFWLSWNSVAKNEGAVRSVIDEPRVSLVFGQEKVDFFKPDSKFLPSEDGGGNNGSLVFTLRTPQHSFIFSGDAEVLLELALIKTFCPSGLISCGSFRADYLKVGHHGSDSSTGDEWLEVVRPKTAIVSVGKNKFGHPSLRVMRKLERMGIGIWRTDDKGDIIVGKE